MHFAAYRLHKKVLEPINFLRWGYLFQVILAPNFKVAFPVPVHAVMHDLFLQELCVEATCYVTSTGQRLALLLQEWTVDSYAKIESARLN